MNGFRGIRSRAGRIALPALLVLVALALLAPGVAPAQTPGQPAAPAVSAPAVGAPAAAPHGGGEANLRIPDLGQVQFLGVNGRTLLVTGLGVLVLGPGF